MNEDFLSKEKISELFIVNKEKNKMQKRESATLEYKESFNFGGMAMYFRTIASFANRNGGYIIFGVKDKPREPIGLKKKNLQMFEELKIEEFTNNLNEYFAPEIIWEHCTYEFEGNTFGIIYIHELENKPAICKKNYDAKEEKYSLKDGDIYYRYAGRSQRIKYPELVSIVDEKRKKEERLWLDYLIKSAKIGIENIGILDLKKGNIQSKNIKSMYIDEKLLKQIKFVQEGIFKEKEGTPTLKLMGEIENVNGEKIILKEGKEKIKLRSISEFEIIETFLKDKDISEEVEEFIKALPNCKSGFMPVYHYLLLNNSTIEEGVDLINSVKVRTRAKTKLIQRLEDKRREKQKIPLLRQIEIESIIADIESEKIKHKDKKQEDILMAILCMNDDTIYNHKEYIKLIVYNIFNKMYDSEDRTLVGKIRKAICRIDEAIYDYQDK